MKSVEEICKIAADVYGYIHLANIIEDEEVYYLFPTDQYGNNFFGPPLLLDKKTGKPAAISEDDFSYSGVYQAVPAEYISQKGILANKFVSESDELGLDEYQIALALNSLFLEDYWDLELPAMYAVCRCFLSIISCFCSEDEMNDAFELVQNEHIHDYLCSSKEEKIAQSREFYVIPDNVQRYIDCSEVIQRSAMKHLNNEPFDLNDFHAAKQGLSQMKADVVAEVQTTEDMFVDKGYLLEKLNWVDEQVALECAFCEGESDIKSERMLKPLFAAPDFSFNGNSELFGTMKPFGDGVVTFTDPSDI